nr:tRNA (adenosine(37)-N6)-threonylcarbamoyltransferase complex transferase subunit TsaD [bacterium]
MDNQCVNALSRQPAWHRGGLLLAIESSCDETAAALLDGPRHVKSQVIASQASLHALYGGVVPEIASRQHSLALYPCVAQAMEQAGATFSDIDAVAVTMGPGLVGALLTGVNYAKGLAYALGRPLIGVHHIEGHIAANYLTNPDLQPPYLCLVASGGHSHLVAVEEAGYRLLGRTRDDAAGEAFDKAARMLGLPYPGGPRVDEAAERGREGALHLPQPKIAGGELDFSFSGLKTAMLQALERANKAGQPVSVEDAAASFRRAVVDQLVSRCMRAAEQTGASTVAVAGGVAGNRLLRRKMQAACQRRGIRLCMPSLDLCGDNAAMIGCAAWARLDRGERSDFTLNAQPSLTLF